MAIDLSSMSTEDLVQLADQAKQIVEHRKNQAAETQQNDKFELVRRLKLVEEIEALEKKIKALDQKKFKSTVTLEFDMECQLAAEDVDLMRAFKYAERTQEEPKEFIYHALEWFIEPSVKNIKDEEAQEEIDRLTDDVISDMCMKGLPFIAPDAWKAIEPIVKKGAALYKKIQKNNLTDTVNIVRNQLKS